MLSCVTVHNVTIVTNVAWVSSMTSEANVASVTSVSKVHWNKLMSFSLSAKPFLFRYLKKRLVTYPTKDKITGLLMLSC